MQPYSTKDDEPRPILDRSGFYPPKSTEDGGLTSASPMVIPPKRGSHTSLRRDTRSRPSVKAFASSRRSSSSSSNDRQIPTSVASMLNATAIPVPRRTWSNRRPRKVPRGNHVEEFSRMLKEDLKSKDDDLMTGTGNSPLDILLSPPDEENDKDTPGNDSEHEMPFSLESASSDSMPSLDHDVASPSSSILPPTPNSQKSPSERRCLRYSPSEDCAFDHPLLETEIQEGETIDCIIHNDPIIHKEESCSKRTATIGSFPRLRSSFKSNLTASLRAIKSAAQSVSTFATPSVQPEDFLTRNIFTITPELTDDRRPAPMRHPPSPALRRYYNPTPISPAEMYVYHDHPHEKLEPAHACPVSIQMQTYRRSRGRGNRRNHFHVVAPKNRDQYTTFDPEVPPLSRQREPRENSDFLRMVVLEMNMRRRGKLREDIPPRARIWLPPRRNNPNRLSGDYEDGDDNDTVPSRWVGVSA
ncbi:hypothetical protein PENSTE_c004G00355 [Penicillium steckii]|uniref:Uncharacterized protein n=1 Tax=Penicillium steckii TaxID=303698 RepID=A0A1V6TML1_9EURO|nr:hypothetical protein PENSTE_c004G00355 [Penicillium steckii]